ncbi:FadR/GntR family transcriptional regulator [Blastococcus tunisiensis]|uniref:DNA-binding transcriptional regulator, FadR family n=1 Tax=Blastococcus tunisiensis TaxID=1798228 RepID=A0A1I2H5N8_9ACTN|nr:FadR/GntR family transcriptional regulator [Blastococcus sp. DSM 46838]SFF24693.1 DNA-binding transcriptional regulator, FadR family [Blastococcus sp. DSM 46838]
MSEGSAPSNAGLFQPVAVGRISQAIVDQVRALIRTGELAIGARLPSERELCERFGVSRVTVREALRVLEANGLIEIRVGSRGGAFVTAPTTGRIGEGITDLLSMSALSAAEVTEARVVFELGVVPLVCERATDEELDELMALCDEAARAREGGTYTVTMSFDFHLRVAAAAHNPALVMLMRSLREPVLMSLREAQHEGRQGVAEHRTFVEAVRARDADRAQRVMAEHLQRTARRVAGR